MTEISNSGEIPTVAPERPSEDVLRASVARTVHYVSHGSADGTYPSMCRAAIIAEASPRDDGACVLVVLNPTGIFFGVCTYDDGEHEPGTWHWPETV